MTPAQQGLTEAFLIIPFHCYSQAKIAASAGAWCASGIDGTRRMHPPWRRVSYSQQHECCVPTTDDDGRTHHDRTASVLGGSTRGGPAVFLTLVLGTAPAVAARDRTAPTTPAILRVASTLSYQVALAWDPSTDTSGALFYRVVAINGATSTVPQTHTPTEPIGFRRTK